MLQLSPQTKVHVALAPTDMRRGFAGLSGEVRQVLEQMRREQAERDRRYEARIAALEAARAQAV